VAFIAPEMDEVPVTIIAAKSARPNVTQNLILNGTLLAPGKPPVYRIAPAIPVKVIAEPPPPQPDQPAKAPDKK